MKILKMIIAVLLIVQCGYSEDLNVATTYRYIGDIVKRIGKEKVDVFTFARGDYNPHFIIPKPSYIAKMRKANLLIINGGQLEIGWIPPIISQANNPDVQSSGRGFLDLSKHVQLIDVPSSVSRDQGDVHPDGNPHFALNPENIITCTKVITEKLSELDPADKAYFQKNRDEFLALWQQKMKEWESKMHGWKGAKVVEYHRVYDYLFRTYGITVVGTIEPVPGIPPTTKHIAEMEALINREKVKCILQDVYNPQDASSYVSKNTGVKMVVLPHDVDAVKEADNIISLFDEIVRRLSNV